MLLVGRVTWTLSVCVQLCCVISFLIPYNLKSTGSMGGIKVFAGPGEIPLPNMNTEIQR
jgi:hypothetical protein